MTLDQQPLGIFDSGIGGFTVVEALRRIAPQEHIVYLKDEANFPYGNKNPQEIVELSLNAATILLKYNIKIFVVACHTASVLAKDALRAHVPIPVIDLTSSSVQAILSMKGIQRLAIIGTQATIQSNVYPTLLQQARPSLKTLSLSMPYLAPLIEIKENHHETLSICLEKDLLTIKNFAPDALFLACTHYPLISSLLTTLLGPTIPLIDSAIPAAEEVVNTLKNKNLLNKSPLKGTLTSISVNANSKIDCTRKSDGLTSR